jgi:hypothetical protein
MFKHSLLVDHTEDTDVARVVPREANSVTVTVFGPVDVSVAVSSCVVVKTRQHEIAPSHLDI